MRRADVLRRGRDGLAVVSVLEHRLALGVVIVATLWFAAVACWGLFGPLLAGHYAASASVGIIADNMLRWGIVGPVWEYTAAAPAPDRYYCNHPWGIFWTTALFMKALGRHDVVCRLPAVLLSVATPVLLFALGRAIWRPAAGAVAAAAFVVLPITLSFAHFNALEVPVIAWSLLGLWGYVRFTQTWRRGHAAASLLGLTLAMHADWPAFVLVGLLLVFAAARGLLHQGRWPFGRVRLGPYVRWWLLLAGLAVATLLLYVALFAHAGKLDDLFDRYRLRSSGSHQPLAAVLASRRYWIELMFTPAAIAMGKVAAVVCALRLVVLRREHELLPLLVLAMAAFQYLVFKQGADVHIYWPHYFAAFFALGMGAVAASALEAAGRPVDGRGRHARWLVGATAALLLCLLPVLRDGVPALVYARGTGGRFNEKGLLIHSDGAKTAFLRWLEPQLAPDAQVGLHDGMKATWSQVWALGGRVATPNVPLPDERTRHDVYLADTRFLYDEAQARLAAGHRLFAVGPFWRVDLGAPPGLIEAFRLEETAPEPWARYWLYPTEPVRQVVPDPFLTWQLRHHFGQEAPPPEVPPQGLEQLCVAYNVALVTGSPAGPILERVRRMVQGPTATASDGTELLGQARSDLGRLSLTLVWRAAGPAAADVQPVVTSRVVAAAPWSTTMADPVVRRVSTPLGLAPQRWKPGFCYTQQVVLRPRPGVEVFELGFEVRRGSGATTARAPRWRDDARMIELLRLQ